MQRIGSRIAPSLKWSPLIGKLVTEVFMESFVSVSMTTTDGSQIKTSRTFDIISEQPNRPLLIESCIFIIIEKLLIFYLCFVLCGFTYVSSSSWRFVQVWSSLAWTTADRSHPLTQLMDQWNTTNTNVQLPLPSSLFSLI